MAANTPRTYAETIRAAMESAKLSLRGLARATGFSYEHARRVLSGDPVASKKFNSAVARVLSLDEGELWGLAQRDKAVRRYGRRVVSERPVMPPEAVAQLWERLTQQDRARVLGIMQGLAEAAAVESETESRGLPSKARQDRR